MSLLNWSTLNGKSRCVIFKMVCNHSWSLPVHPQPHVTWHSNIFTIATQRETRPLACTWPWVEDRDCATLHAIHQAPPEPEHRGDSRMKQTNISNSIDICCLSSPHSGNYAWIVTIRRCRGCHPVLDRAISSKQVENTGVRAKTWKVWYKLNFAGKYDLLTAPRPRLNNESEPMLLFFFVCFSIEPWCVTCSCLSQQFPTCPE